MQSTNLPSKYLVPFATNDSARVEIPVTTATVGRASQSLGFPPITGQPPETGGQPPQLEDFNGAVNQIARVAWWAQLGGLWRYDGTFANDTNINGYPLGSVLQSVSDTSVLWLSTVQNNVADPDATGTGWVPLVTYAPATVTTAGGTTTVALPVAAHRTLVVSGTLSSNATVVLPNWVREWTITNSTTGAFTVTVKTAAGSGVIIPQNGAPTQVNGDGTNIVATAPNIPLATTGTQAAQFSQTTGRLINTQIFTANGTYTPTAGTTSVIVAAIAGGGGGGGVPSTTASQQATAAGGISGGYIVARLTTGFSGAAVVVGTAGAFGGPTTSGGNGGNTTFGTAVTAPGGTGGTPGTATGATAVIFPGTVSGTDPTTTGVLLESLRGSSGIGANVLSLSQILGGTGGDSPWGRGGRPVTGQPGNPATGFGGGGSGASGVPSQGGANGGAGSAGRLVVYEYA